MNVERKFGEGTELVWHDRKRWCGMPLSFTRYYLVRKPGQWVKAFSNIGLLYSSVNEINLYRIYDISLHQSLTGKIFNTGNVILLSNDESNPRFVLRNVKNPFQVREIFSNLIEEQRKLNNVRVSELQF